MLLIPDMSGKKCTMELLIKSKNKILILILNYRTLLEESLQPILDMNSRTCITKELIRSNLRMLLNPTFKILLEELLLQIPDMNGRKCTTEPLIEFQRDLMSTHLFKDLLEILSPLLLLLPRIRTSKFHNSLS